MVNGEVLPVSKAYRKDVMVRIMERRQKRVNA